MNKIPLEEALALVKFPVYGLTEEVCGLRYRSHMPFALDHFRDFEARGWNNSTFTIHYQTERYKPYLHAMVSGPTFSVNSLQREHEVATMSTYLRIMEWNPDKIPEADRRPVFSCKGSISIAGKMFTGIITYRPAPLCHSVFELSSGRMCLDGQALGPHPDDLIQILEALRVLNDK